MVALPVIMSFYTGKTGYLLVATDLITEPTFAKTVIYIDHNSFIGAHGIILNKPKKLNAKYYALDGVNIYDGGPIKAPENIYYILDRPRASSQWQWQPLTVKILDPVYIKHGKEKINDVFLGYAGWGPMQLEREIKAGAWLVVPATPDILLGERDRQSLWQKLYKK